MNIRRTAVQVTSYKKAVTLMEKVNFDSLNKTVSDLIGIDIEFKYKVQKSKEGSHPVVTIFSETDVKENTGFLKNTFEKVLIQDFGAMLCEVYEFDQDLIDAYVGVGDWESVNNVPQTFISSYLELFLDARIFLKSGGSNGFHILSAKYDFETEKWNI